MRAGALRRRKTGDRAESEFHIAVPPAAHVRVADAHDVGRLHNLGNKTTSNSPSE